MNAESISTTNFHSDNPHDSDSDTNSDEIIPDYYQPISSTEINGEPDPHNHTINGYHQIDENHLYGVENGVRSLDLSDGEDEEEEKEEEEERRRVEMENAMRRAFREDGSRRNTPLSSENASRVMEAMRGVSFSGPAPDWVRGVPEDRWVHQLQRLRQPGSPA